jgi:hypothetical protein
MSDAKPSGDVPHTHLPGDQGGRIYDEGFLDSESRIEGSDARQNFALWIAVLGSAVVWFLQLQTSYSLVTWACSTGSLWSLHAASVLFLVLAAVPGWIAWKEWSASSAGAIERTSAGAGRRRFMAMLGLLLTGLFLLLIIAQAIPSFFFDPCLS